MQNKNYGCYPYPTKLDLKFKQINLELQHYAKRCDQAGRC